MEELLTEAELVIDLQISFLSRRFVVYQESNEVFQVAVDVDCTEEDFKTIEHFLDTCYPEHDYKLAIAPF